MMIMKQRRRRVCHYRRSQPSHFAVSSFLFATLLIFLLQSSCTTTTTTTTTAPTTKTTAFVMVNNIPSPMRRTTATIMTASKKPSSSPSSPLSVDPFLMTMDELRIVVLNECGWYTGGSVTKYDLIRVLERCSSSSSKYSKIIQNKRILAQAGEEGEDNNNNNNTILNQKSIKILKELVRSTFPKRGILSTLKRKQDYIDYLLPIAKIAFNEIQKVEHEKEISKREEGEEEFVFDREALSLLSYKELKAKVNETLYRDLSYSNYPCGTHDDSVLKQLKSKQDCINYSEIEPLTIEEEKYYLYDIGFRFIYQERKEKEAIVIERMKIIIQDATQSTLEKHTVKELKERIQWVATYNDSMKKKKKKNGGDDDVKEVGEIQEVIIPSSSSLKTKQDYIDYFLSISPKEI